MIIREQITYVSINKVIDKLIQLATQAKAPTICFTSSGNYMMCCNVPWIRNKQVKRLVIFIFGAVLFLVFYLFITLFRNLSSIQEMRLFFFYLIKPVEGGAFLHELRQVLLPVELVGLCHGCSQTWEETKRKTGVKARGGFKDRKHATKAHTISACFFPVATKSSYCTWPSRGSSKNTREVE